MVARDISVVGRVLINWVEIEISRLCHPEDALLVIEMSAVEVDIGMGLLGPRGRRDIPLWSLFYM